MRYLGWYLIAGFFFLASTNDLAAQRVWKLEECIAHGLEHSLDIELANLGVLQDEINLKQNKAQRYPNLNANADLGWNFGRTIDPTTDAFSTETFFSNGYSLSSGVVIFDGFRIKNSIKQSETNLKASTVDTKQSQRDLALLIATTYLNALFAEENTKNAQAQLELSQEQLKQVDKLIAAGSRPRNERLDLLAQISTNEQDIIGQENSRDIAILQLQQLMNLDPSETISIQAPPDGAVSVRTDPDAVTFQEVYEQALQNQPNIEAGEYRMESASLGLDIAKSGNYPTLTVGGSLGSNYSNLGKQVDGFEQVTNTTSVLLDNNPVNITSVGQQAILSKNPYFNQLDENLRYGIGFNLSYPIFDNYSRGANIERAKLTVLNTKNQNERLRQNLKTNVQQSLADARAAKRSLESAGKTLEAQKAAFENAQKRFDLGAINTYDYIQAKNLFDRANTSLIIAKYDYLFRLKLLDFYRGFPLTLE